MKCIAIIGVGNVGSTIAQKLIYYNLCDEILLCDINKEKAWAEKEDLSHGCMIQGSKIVINTGPYEECSRANIIVISASAKYYKGMKREDFTKSSFKIVSEILSAIQACNFKGIYIIVTNPVDLITNLVCFKSNCNYSKIIGAGTILDTFRLKYELNRRNYYNIDLCCIGEHGGDLIVPFNSIKFNNKDCDVSKIYSISNQLIDNINLLSNRIMETKNSTTWGISAAVLKIIDAIINDKKVILPISHYVNLPFLNDEICFSYPAKIGANGIIEQFDMELLSQEQTILKEISCKTKKALNLAKIMKEKIQ